MLRSLAPLPCPQQHCSYSHHPEAPRLFCVVGVQQHTLSQLTCVLGAGQPSLKRQRLAAAASAPAGLACPTTSSIHLPAVVGCGPQGLLTSSPASCSTNIYARYFVRHARACNVSPPSAAAGDENNTNTSQHQQGSPAPAHSTASTSGSGPEPSGGKPPNRASRQPTGIWKVLSWFAHLAGEPKAQLPLRLLVNVFFLWMLMRLWPVGGRSADSADPLIVNLPFSEFVKCVKSNEVQQVAVDGLHINFSLRPNSPVLQKRLQGVLGAAPAAAVAQQQHSQLQLQQQRQQQQQSAQQQQQQAQAQQQAAPPRVSFYTVRPSDYPIPYDALESNSVVFSAVERRDNSQLTVLGYVVLVGLLLSTLNRLPLKAPQKGPGRKHQGSGGGGNGLDGASVTTTFTDVAGVDEAKEELQEIVEYLRSPERFSRLGARPPSGVLLVGPPGTGKTLLARAVAGEAGVPFFSISASEFVELYVGMGAMRVRELFAAARKEAPAIVFIDEIDAVAKGRDMRLRSVGNDEREQTLNQLLTELDGFETDKDNVVICIAATNRPDVLDPALLRPGRFDRRVAVERPDRVGREQILRVHLGRRGLPLAADVSPGEIASMTTGFTGADLANLVNEAALLGGRRGKQCVGREEFDAAVMRAVAGIEKKRSILQGTEKAVVARHEVGHALVGTAVARLLAGFGEPSKLSIIPRSGGALGFTYTPPKAEDRALLFDSEIRAQLAVLMGGRAAEHLTCDAVSTGAADDIRRATDLAYRSVSEFGLNRAVGPINVSVLANGGSDGDGLGLLMKDGGDMARLVEKEVREMLEGALTAAMSVILANKGVHEGLSTALHTHERLEGEELVRWLQHTQVPDSLRRFVVEGTLPSRDALGVPARAPQGSFAI